MHGWIGKIARVNLSKNDIASIPTQPYAEKYLGGRGIASRLYWELSRPESVAFNPANPLIFMTGPLVASGARGANIMAVVGKSPAALPENYCFGNISGYVAAELKKAGFDGIIVEGRASGPVYLWINGGEIEIRDASSLWGQGTYRVAEMLQQYHGEDTRFITIGVSGEKLVRTAITFASHESALSCGFGAVMGSKNLKALAIRGSGQVSVADPAGLKKLNLHTAKIDKRLHLAIAPGIYGLASKIEVTGGGGCYLCGATRCIRNRHRYDGRLERVSHCETQGYYNPAKYGKEDEPIDTVYIAPELANDYALDIFEIEHIVDWLYEGYKAGVFTEAATGLPLSEIGTRRFLEELLQAIAYREGFGNILAEGLARAGDRVSPEAKALVPRSTAPIGTYTPNPLLLPVCLAYAMETRVYQSGSAGVYEYLAWLFNRDEKLAFIFHQPEATGGSPITTKVFKGIARAFWGGEAAGDLSSYEGKALAAVLAQNRACLRDSLGLCSFTYPITYSSATADNVGDPDLEAKIYTAVTGKEAGELERYGDIIFNLQRMILLREGRRTPAQDFPRDYLFEEPMAASPVNPEVMAPGPGETVVSLVDWKLDREKYRQMLREYYRLRGWDEDTGIPRPETLAALGMDILGGVG